MPLTSAGTRVNRFEFGAVWRDVVRSCCCRTAGGGGAGNGDEFWVQLTTVSMVNVNIRQRKRTVFDDMFIGLDVRVKLF